jgi:hypothetical protein
MSQISELNDCLVYDSVVGDGFPVPVILEQNRIASAIISFGNPENENVFGQATKRRPYDVKRRYS